MANQLKMADVQTILALHQRGWSDRKIARELGVDRGTVGNYVRLNSPDPAKPANAPTGSTELPPLAAESIDSVAESKSASAPTGSLCLSSVLSDITVSEACGSKPANAPTGFAGAPADMDAAAIDSAGAESRSRGPLSTALPWREAILQKLDQGLSAQRIYQDLTDPAAGHGYTGSYYSIRRLVQKLTASSEPPVRRMESPPGAEAQVDFGQGAPIVSTDGKRKKSWVFRIVLSHSRKGYSEAVSHQTTDEFLRCLENAFAHFGGVPQTLVIDNLRAAVSRADWFDPELCPKVRSFAEHYGIAILPTRPRTPRHKGKVENGVKYVKDNSLKGMKFASLAEENQHLWNWEATVADRRIHGTTRQQVSKLFMEVEKPALLPLPAGRFELFHEAPRSVHRDGHVVVKGAHYSLPPEYLGQEIWARWDGRTVRLFDQKMRPIAIHVQKPPGAFSTNDAHLHPHKINNIEKGANWMLGQADRIGPKARAWAQSMLSSRGIEGMRVLMGLLSLPSKHPRLAIERACEVALGHGTFRLRSLRQLIEHQQDRVRIRARHHPARGRLRPVAARCAHSKTNPQTLYLTGVYDMSYVRPSLLQTLRQLRLSGLAESLAVRLSEAAGNRLDHGEFLELILQDELSVRAGRQVQRRVKSALFRESKSLDEFDFSFNPAINRRQIEELATCRFIREKTDVLFLGPPGVGKSFLVQAIGMQAIRSGMLVLYRSIFDLARDFLEEQDAKQQDKTLNKYLKPDLLIIDDMGMKQLPRRSGECLLEIIMRRHENRSTVMTSNRPLEDWAKLIGDVPAATAILDRFLQHAAIISITGKSYRLRNGGKNDSGDKENAGAKTENAAATETNANANPHANPQNGTGSEIESKKTNKENKEGGVPPAAKSSPLRKTAVP